MPQKGRIWMRVPPTSPHEAATDEMARIYPPPHQFWHCFCSWLDGTHGCSRCRRDRCLPNLPPVCKNLTALTNKQINSLCRNMCAGTRSRKEPAVPCIQHQVFVRVPPTPTKPISTGSANWRLRKTKRCLTYRSGSTDHCMEGQLRIQLASKITIKAERVAQTKPNNQSNSD